MKYKQQKDELSRLFWEVREVLKLKQEAFAVEIGMTQGAISRIERGLFEPKATALINLGNQYKNDPTIKKKIERVIFELEKKLKEIT